MNRRLDNELRNWLRAEAQGRPEEAEKRLAAVFRARPADGPSRAFIARTMARLTSESPVSVASDRERTRVTVLLDWAFKLGVAVSVVLAGGSAILLSGMVAAFARGGGGEQAVGWGIGLLAAATEQVARSIALWDGLNRVAGATAAAVLGPQSLAAVAAGLLICLFAFRWLAQLVVFERSANHA